LANRLRKNYPRTVPDDFAREFQALYLDNTRVPLTMDRYTWWCLMSAVQLASRHPKAAKTAPIRNAVEVARQIQLIVTTTPALRQVAEQGWDQILDL